MKKIYLILAPLLLIIVYSGVLKSESSPQGNDEIWVVTDIHYLSETLKDDGAAFTQFIESGDGKNIPVIEEILNAFLSELKEKHPAALLVTGDLTFNGEKKSHKDLAKWFREVESQGTDVYVIPGNHDINNPWARKITENEISGAPTISADDFVSIYKNFGYNEALSRDSASLSYLIEPVPGIRILMLDTCNYDNNLALGIPMGYGQIFSETKSWIQEAADDSKKNDKALLAAMHHSLLEHNPMVSNGFTIEDNESLMDFFSGLEIRTFLTGHIHIQDIIMDEADGRGILDITTNALSVYPHNFGRIYQENGNLVYSAVSLSDQPLLSEGVTRESLEEFFIRSSDRMVRKTVAEAEFSHEEIVEMAALLSRANLNFFSGRESPDGLDPSALRLFRKDSRSFLSEYLFSILKDSPPGDQNVKLKF